MFLSLIGLSRVTLIFRVSLVLLVVAACAVGMGLPHSNGPFDEFGDVNCESEMARLDNFAVSLQISLQADRSARGEIIFFAGRMAGDKLPRRGEAEARAERIRSYLVKRREVPAASLVVMNGGYDSDYRIQLWIVPPGADLAKPKPLSSVKDVRYRKGNLNLS